MIFKYLYAFVVFAVQNLCLAQISISDGVPSKSPANFESFASLSTFPNANDKFNSTLPTVTEIPGSFGKPIFSFPLGDDIAQPTAATGTNAASPFKNNQPSTIPSSLETFISTFTNAVHTTPILSDLFDVSSISLQSFENFIHQDAQLLYKRLGISEPLEVATYPSNPLPEHFEILTYPMLVRIDANAMGKHLLAEGILNDNNAVSLALSFANEMEAIAKQSVKKNYPTSKFRPLMDGYVAFLKSQGLYTAEKIVEAGRYFRDEVGITGKRFGKSASNNTLTII